MTWLVSQIVGTGADAEGNEWRPAAAQHIDSGWTCTADGRGGAAASGQYMLVRGHAPRADELSAIGRDSRVEALTASSALLAAQRGA